VSDPDRDGYESVGNPESMKRGEQPRPPDGASVASGLNDNFVRTRSRVDNRVGTRSHRQRAWALRYAEAGSAGSVGPSL